MDPRDDAAALEAQLQRLRADIESRRATLEAMTAELYEVEGGAGDGATGRVGLEPTPSDQELGAMKVRATLALFAALMLPAVLVGLRACQ